MPIKRIFLGWEQPALPVVARYLLERSRSSGIVDLSHLILVFPGSQAGRRCLELLREQAGGRLSPPRIVTVGQLPELLYQPQRPFAPLLVQQLVWAQALREMPAQRLGLLMSVPPSAEDQAGWLRLGDLLRQQHEELARDQLNFADVWQRGKQLAGFQEVDRWKLLSEIQQSYWKLLDHYELWDQQTARLVAIQQQECRTNCEIVAVGTVDLNRTLRSMLHQVADKVTALISAPAEWADRFDEFGCVIPEQWNNQSLDLSDDQVLLADDAGMQCASVLSILTELDGKYTLDEITIGLPDPQLVLPLQRTLEEYGVPSHWPVECRLAETGPYRLLNAVASFLEEATPHHFAALIRHPDIGRWLDCQKIPPDWLNRWDRYFNDHLPQDLNWISDGPNASVVLRVQSALRTLLAPFSSEKSAFAAWGNAVHHLLVQLYGDLEFADDDPVGHRLRDACRILQSAFAEQGRVPEGLDCNVTAVEAIRLILRNANVELYRRGEEHALQLAGWLEMPLNDAPVAIITTFNETFIPTSVNHDLFLPNRLRTHLGIEDNYRRYARDLYLLSTLIHSRKVLRLIVSRRDTKQDPLIPSRLLFATDPEQIAQRVLAFYDPQHRKPLSVPASPLQIAAESDFPIPCPISLEEPHSVLRVTEFRDYLASPYRYYLRHVLKLQEVTDDLDELDSAAFGTLVHDVLKLFGQGPRAGSSDPAVIADTLETLLQQVIETQYGHRPLAAVLIQAEQARRRLRAFANWQANWRRDGWEIHSTELGNLNPVPFPLGDGRSVSLKGRIDRIDIHRETGEWAIFDYKTGDAGVAPEKTHRSKESWTDLQLPLYRHLTRDICGDDPVRLGYIVLPRDSHAVAAVFAEWSADDLAEAEETAQRVGRDILDQKFWVPLSEPAGTMSEFDVICQFGVFGQEILL